MTNIDDKLAKLAKEAGEKAYAPYSNFRVGAALVTESGNIYTGCNIENAAYPATVCGEDVAVFKAISEGYKKFTLMTLFQGIISFITRAGLVAFILNITMIFIGYYMAKFLASGLEQRKCISLECGLQNGTLAVFVATQLWDDIVFMVPTAAYALIMFVTSIIFVLIVRKIN